LFLIALYFQSICTFIKPISGVQDLGLRGS